MANTVGGDFAQGVLNETAYAIPELFGFKAPASQDKFRAEHPIASFGASLLIDAVPYAGWFAASKKIKRFDTLVAGVGNAAKSPFLTGAAQTALRFAPLEAARVGVNAAFGDTPNSEMLTSALTNELAGGFLGGAGDWVLSGGRKAKKLAGFTQFDTSKPTQLQLRALDAHMQKPDLQPDVSAALLNHRASLRELARAEALDTQTAQYIAPMVTGDHKAVGRLFDTNNTKATTLVRKRFVDSKIDFTTPGAWQVTAQRAGLPADFEQIAQYPRYVAFKGQQAAKSASDIEHVIGKNMTQIGDNWFMNREAGDGLYVMARKIAGAPGMSSPHDEWVVLKTDKPELFATKVHADVSSAINASAWEPAQKIATMDLGGIGGEINKYHEQMPKENWAILDEAKGNAAKAFDQLKGMVGLKTATSELEVVSRLRNFYKEYLQPSMFQFKKSPEASRILSLARMGADHAEALTDKFIHGEYKAPTSDANLLNESLKSASNLSKQNALRTWTHEKLTEKDLAGVNDLWKQEAPPEQVLAAYQSGKISKNGFDFMQLLKAHNDAQMLDINKVNKAVGRTELTARTGHLGISRQWEGDQMIALRDSGGGLHDIASGYNNREAQKNAELLLARNPALHIAERFDRSRMDGVPKDATNALNTPSWQNARGKIGGYKFDLQPWTKEELLKLVEDNVRSRNKYQAEATVREMIKPELGKLLQNEPDTAKQLLTRIDDVFGKQRPLGIIQNRIADKILAPMLGKNSASTIASQTNSAMWQLNLGAGNLGFVVQQALGPVQTVLPEIAFVLNGSTLAKAAHYDHFAAGGEHGPVGIVSALSPIKIMVSAFTDMRKPEASLLSIYERATQERIIGPKITEEFIGESASTIKDLRSAFNSGAGFVGWIRAVSEFLPAQTERLTRAFSLAVGHRIYKDFFGLEGDALYRNVKQFVTRTNYLYGAVDRPGMFTSPAGAVFGQFKNWMMHYMHAMGEYTGEGFVRGNWSPLLWQQAGTWAVGGLAASPMINAADAFNSAFSDKSLVENTYATFNDRTADGIFYGLPALLGGVSLSSQTTTPFTNPARDAEMLYSFVLMDRLKNMGATVGAGMDAWNATGQHPGKNAHFRDLLIRTLAPKSLYKTMQVVQDDNINSLQNGYPVMKNVGMFDKMLYASGIPPAEVERNFAVSDILWKEKAARQAAVASYGEAYYEAMIRKDSHMMAMILRKSQLEGLTSSVLSSAFSRASKSHEDSMTRNFGHEAVARFNSVIGQ